MDGLHAQAGPPPLCPHAAEGCAGAAVCRFAGIDRPRLRTLDRAERIALEPGPDRMRFRAVRSGLAAVAAETREGRRQILCLTGPDELICPAVPRRPGVRIEALTRTTVCEIDLRGATAELARNPEFTAQLFELAGRGLDHAAAQLVALGRLGGTERVLAFLADLTDRLGRREGAATRLSLPMSREDMADCLGLTPETVSRIMTRLRKAGVLRLPTPTLIEVPDPAALSA